MGDSEQAPSSTPRVPDDADELEVLEYLTRSPLRVNLLVWLASTAPVAERAVRAEYDVARTTITRTLDGFADRGFIDRAGGDCTVTAYGAAIASTLERTISDLGPHTELEPFLRRVPATAFDLDPGALADADVTVAEPGSPYAPVEAVTDLRARSSTVRELSSIVAQDSAEQVHDRAKRGDASFEIVLQDDVIEQIHADDGYRTQFEAAVEEPAVDVRVYEGTFPFLVVLLDDAVALGATNDEEMPAVLVVGAADRVREWAESLYQEFYEQATPYEEYVT
ncbi:MAG: helix-turn-helix transcriptional regulator [Halobacteriaceae archaeon]